MRKGFAGRGGVGHDRGVRGGGRREISEGLESRVGHQKRREKHYLESRGREVLVIIYPGRLREKEKIRLTPETCPEREDRGSKLNPLLKRPTT